MKNISLLGSTGSIGVNALKVIQAHPDQYRVLGLAAGRNIQLLLTQIEVFRPKAVCVFDKEAEAQLRRGLAGRFDLKILQGPEGFRHLATLDGTDTVISAITGAAGLLPTHAAIRAGKNVALANKETMVMAGEIIMSEARKQGVSILPVDSEHCAILQSLQGHPPEDIRRVILTASGGPFRDMSLSDMRHVTPAQALNTPIGPWERRYLLIQPH